MRSIRARAVGAMATEVAWEHDGTGGAAAEASGCLLKVQRHADPGGVHWTWAVVSAGLTWAEETRGMTFRSGHEAKRRAVEALAVMLEVRHG